MSNEVVTNLREITYYGFIENILLSLLFLLLFLLLLLVLCYDDSDFDIKAYLIGCIITVLSLLSLVS